MKSQLARASVRWVAGRTSSREWMRLSVASREVMSQLGLDPGGGPPAHAVARCGSGRTVADMPTYTASRPLEGDADEYFDYVSDPENLPAYFPRMTDAHELPDGKVETTAHVDADQDGTDETVTSEANFDVDRAAREVTWSAPGPHDYHGSLRLTDDGVELTIHTTQDFDGMQQALDGSLAKIAENLRAKA